MKIPVRILSPFITVTVLFLWGCGNNNNSSPIPSSRVAVYDGTGSWHDSAIAAKAALVADSQLVNFVTEDDIQASLNDYGLLVMTGEDPRQILAALGSTGRFQIEDLVQRGGGFIGLGVGSYIAADSIDWQGQPILETPVGLYSGLATGPLTTLAPPSGYAMVSVTLHDNRFNPALIPSLQVAYREGPALLVDYPSASVIGSFDLISEVPAAVAFERGLGRVVLFAVNPEFEENSNADGTSWGSDLTDPESDWFWLQFATEWCLRQIQ
ncbi:MAG: BPL-N domain-containing protein [bacterium]